jgi:transcriptional regulator with XRE-family HTH domain
MASLSDQIRDALDQSDHSTAEISRATGVHRVNLSQFKSGRRALPLVSLEAIAEFLGFSIVLVPRRDKTRSGQKHR